ncbi:MAG: methyltransferase domain-containing protein [Bacteroidia bacterium]|nr:methyltransferase domain-containing protein [Bacteroidia bacterium]
MKSTELKLAIAARAVKKALKAIDPDQLNISDYNKKYLQKHRLDSEYIFSIYIKILKNIVKLCNKPMREIRLVDYGAGTGLLGIIAKKAGFASVTYCDIYNVSRDDARVIAPALGVPLNHYLCGDTSILTIELKNKIDAIVSMDVIEHIYNIDDFFKDCSMLNSELSMVHVTGSNTYNKNIVKKLGKFQNQCEYKGVPESEGIKQADLSSSYFSMRKKIILEQHDLEINDSQIDELATLTRGYNKTDLLKALYEYKVQGILPTPIKHSSNTCNPLTGNWAERLLSEVEMGNIANAYEFNMSWKPLFYNTFRKRSLKNSVSVIANKIIKSMGQYGLKIAPLVMISFKKN